MKIYTFLLLPAFLFLSPKGMAQLNFTALESEGYGVHASACGHSVPFALCGGPSHAYYNLVSVDNAGLPGAKAALHLVSGGSGFSNFRSAITANGFTLDQVEMSFTSMNLGADQYPADWFASNQTETRMYRGGTFTFTLDGEDMVSGNMSIMRLVIDYKSFSNCYDDEVSGRVLPTGFTNASSGSSAGVQAVAAAFLQDIGNLSVIFDFFGLQPTTQGTCGTGATFEAQTGTISLGPIPNAIFQNLNPSAGTPGSCTPASASATSTGSGTWVDIMHNSALVCSFLDSENMGTVTASFYVHNGAVRATPDGTEYFDRNFEINVANQPSGPVRVRLYFTGTEWAAFLAANDNDGNDIEDLLNTKVTKFSGLPCSNAVNGSNGTLLNAVGWGVSDDGDTFYIDLLVNSFSSFFIHGGAAAVLPVELVHFAGAKKEGHILLNWETASEKNNEGFYVQKSYDGKNWENIGFVNGKGFSENINAYFFKDMNPYMGHNYFRLKQMDYDGGHTFSHIVNIKIENENKFGIYPNPAKGEIEIFGTPKNQINITNSFGKLVKTISEYNGPIDISELPGGMYFISIKNGNHWVTERMVKL